MPNRPLKILQLASHSSLRRGGAIQMARLAQGLARRGHQVTAVFNAPAGRPLQHPLLDRLRADGVTLEGIDWSDARNHARLRELWASGPFDVLHAHRETALLFADAALHDLAIPCFVAQRGTIYMPKWLSPEHRLLRRRRVDRIVTVAEAIRRALVWRRWIAPSKIRTIYGGVDAEAFHPGVDGGKMRFKQHVPPGTLIITFASALIAKKGPEYFVQAADRVRRQRQGVQFWIAGKGKEEESLRARVEDLDLGAMVTFLGHVEQMPELFAASDLVVCSSVKGEGLTGTLREALAMKTPVVTTAVAGNTELVEEGVTGYVAKPANVDSLTAAILRALNNWPATRKLAEAGHRRVLDWCDESARSQKIEQLYTEVLESKHLL